MTNKTLHVAAGLAGLTAVALGAFGAHALRDTLAAMPGGKGAETWHTATLYHLVHAVAALAAVLAAAGGAVLPAAQRLWRVAAGCFLAGIALFSGSLYWLALGGPKWLGPVTPLGGLALLAGWALVAAAGWKISETK